MLERLLFIPFGLMLSGMQCFVQVLTEFQASQGWPNYRNSGSTGTPAAPAGDNRNSDAKEQKDMQDEQDWNNDDLKVVRYWVLYTKCDEEEILDTDQVLVNYETTAFDFGCRKAQEWLCDPKNKKKVDCLDKKYITSDVEVIKTFKKRGCEYEKRRTRALEDIRHDVRRAANKWFGADDSIC